MTILSNTAEGGTAGNAVTTGNSGGSSGNAWTGISNAPEYTSTTPIFGSRSILCDGLAADYVVWGTSGSLPASEDEFNFRFVGRLSALPGASTSIIVCSAADESTQIVDFRITTTGQIQIRPNLVLQGTSHAWITANTLFRLEGRVVSHATAGIVELKIWIGSNYLGEVPNQTITLTNQVIGSGVIGEIGFGWINTPTGGPDLIMDGLAVSNEGWIGTPTPRAVSDLAGTAGDTQVSLTWSTPTNGVGASAITDYLVEYRASTLASFPTIPTVGAGRVLTAVQANTTAARTFPNLSSLTKNSGDLLIAIIIGYQLAGATNEGFSAWPTGWTEFHDDGSSGVIATGCAYKWSDGTETGTFTCTQVGTITGHAAMILLSIAGASLTSFPEAGGKATGNNAVIPSPAAFNPEGWDNENTLWIAVHGDGETSTTGTYDGVTAAPTNYNNYVDTGISSDVVGGVEAAVAFRQLQAASEDAGAFTADASNARHAAFMIAVRPNTVWSTFSDGTSTSPGATVTGLTNSTAYEFRTTGVNANGNGLRSNIAGPYTPVPASSASLVKVKSAGAFATKPIKVKAGGVFATKSVKVKVGGTFT